jgi:acetate kinase
MVQVVEHLPSKWEALRSTLSTTKKENKSKRKRKINIKGSKVVHKGKLFTVFCIVWV